MVSFLLTAVIIIIVIVGTLFFATEYPELVKQAMAIRISVSTPGYTSSEIQSEKIQSEKSNIGKPSLSETNSSSIAPGTSEHFSGTSSNSIYSLFPVQTSPNPSAPQFTGPTPSDFSKQVSPAEKDNSVFAPLSQLPMTLKPF